MSDLLHDVCVFLEAERASTASMLRRLGSSEIDRTVRRLQQERVHEMDQLIARLRAEGGRQ